jgi:hypothetical protein
MSLIAWVMETENKENICGINEIHKWIIVFIVCAYYVWCVVCSVAIAVGVVVVASIVAKYVAVAEFQAACFIIRGL